MNDELHVILMYCKRIAYIHNSQLKKSFHLNSNVFKMQQNFPAYKYVSYMTCNLYIVYGIHHVKKGTCLTELFSVKDLE